MKSIKSDLVIVGSGVAGLYCALNIPKDKKVLIITKSEKEECDSYLAQGGICMLKDDSDYDSYFKDTMAAGHFENNRKSVEIMIKSSQEVIKDLISYGVDFERDSDGKLKFTREGAHSSPRILFHQDITGEEITSKLLAAVQASPNIRIEENVCMIDIIEDENQCKGIVAVCPVESNLAESAISYTKEGRALVLLEAANTVWACGGIGGLYQHSTNYPQLTGDALAIALKHKIPLQNPDYIQIHPTTLFSKKKGRAFLISESVRGEGGILLDKNFNRFTDELQPRDVVTKAIYKQMEKDSSDHVWLSMERIPVEEIKNHFSHIYEHCLQEGFDCTKEAIPVVPAQHYFMGGVKVDEWSRTSLKCLYAAGETSCNGVHGKNRLASNSLLESLVFAKRAAKKISLDSSALTNENNLKVALDSYFDTEKVFEGYKSSVLKEIDRVRKIHEQHIA